MTSGNRSDEPIAYQNEEAISRLGAIADVFLRHDRPIHVPATTLDADDRRPRISRPSLARLRAEPLALPLPCPCPIRAVGGQLEGVLAWDGSGFAFLSHHMGDLDHWDITRLSFATSGFMKSFLKSHPQVIVHDLHPDYASTNYVRSVPPAMGSS